MQNSFEIFFLRFASGKYIIRAFTFITKKTQYLNFKFILKEVLTVYMCGIVGYIGPLVTKNLIENLKLLEYRGYDSAGIATVFDNSIFVKKQSGKIEDLEKALHLSPLPDGTCGIAHTRWATHGEANDINAHPHLSMKNTWAVVHNGIIENFKILRDDLSKQGFVFKSQTDSEVIANLMESLGSKSQSPLGAMVNACKSLTGSYALLAICSEAPNTLFLAKNKSPLYVAKCNFQILVSSDPICFVGKAKSYYRLKDNEYCVASKEDISFFNSQMVKIDKTPFVLSNSTLPASKQDYPFYMLKEICEIPAVLENIAKTYSTGKYLKFIDENFLKRFKEVCLIGCGTAYHACLIGEKYFQKLTRLSARAYMASEFRYSKAKLSKNTLYVLVSQSGETADTLAVNQLLRKKNFTTLAITNVCHSTLAQTSSFVLPTNAGIEVAVASTKAYCAQVSVLYMLSLHVKNTLTHKDKSYTLPIKRLSKKLKPFNLDSLRSLIDQVIVAKNVIFIGRDFDYVTGLEACLKLKEITYINASAYPAGELKHGFLALVDEKTLIFVIATQRDLIDKTLNSAYEVLSRKASVVLTTPHEISLQATNQRVQLISLPHFEDYLMPIVTISFFQMLAYDACIKKGLNPDQPRNLAKSVTVE